MALDPVVLQQAIANPRQTENHTAPSGGRHGMFEGLHDGSDLESSQEAQKFMTKLVPKARCCFGGSVLLGASMGVLHRCALASVGS